MWKLRNGFFVFEADKGTGTAPASETDKGTTVDAPAPESGVAPFKAFATQAEYQAEIENTLKDRLKRADEKAAKDKLIANQEFKTLADTEAARATQLQTELDDLKPRVEKYEKALEAHLATLKKGVPAHVLTLMEKLDVADQLEYLATNAESLKPAPAPAGVPGTPKPSGNQTEADKAAASGRATNFYKGKL